MPAPDEVSRVSLATSLDRFDSAVLALLCAVVVAATGGRGGTPRETRSAAGGAVAAGDYLALGDSVTFGYREPQNLPTPDYSKAATFVGYPEDVASALGLHVANAACPGETSSSLVTAGALSNGCENRITGPGGYRTTYPLHVAYRGTQLAYALRFLAAHPDTKLVSLMIGANDAFICQRTTTDLCTSELPQLLRTIRANVASILSAIRNAGYSGTIVIVNYYSLNYSSPISNAFSRQLNTAMDTAAKPFDVRVADGFRVLQQAAAQAGGDSCAAGLLTTLTTGGCGIHPSVAGQSLLALAVEKAL